MKRISVHIDSMVDSLIDFGLSSEKVNDIVSLFEMLMSVSLSVNKMRLITLAISCNAGWFFVVLFVVWKVSADILC
jgi:hypothetical protein